MTESSQADWPGRDDGREVLWEDGERRFLRMGRVGPDGSRQAHLAVQPAHGQRSHAVAARLAHELALKDKLDAAWALKPLAEVRDAGVPTLLAEDCDGRPLERLVAAPVESKRFLRLGAALANAVGRMHACGIVHKDIKAANILVDAAGERVWLTGFGVATRLPRERQLAEPPEFIAGTLSHMAPEQTGRMNRSIDSRSDLYALGVTLYEWLTGALPFTASDPMEWVHCHVARRPAPPATRVAGIAPQLAAIVMKLLAKTPEDRYQTAAGLEHDLRRCLAALDAGGTVDAFALAERDRADRLLLPERLYGRQEQIDVLVSAFDQVLTDGRPRFVLVRGGPGIGKSSVVNELQKALVPQRGLFAAGKFDQLGRDVPYATLAQATRDLVRPLLLKPEEDLARWRDELRRVLEGSGAVLLDLIPELRHVLGELPPVPELPPPAARERFQRALRRCIGVFAQREHPLALFLDDLQWLDGATLDFLEQLLLQPDVRHVLLIGAYRDNEVDAAHPLSAKLKALREGEGAVREVALAPLREDDLASLIEDALHCAKPDAMSLARLVHAKTQGNPFFASQFLHELVDEKVVQFDPDSAQWRWDLGHIEARNYTENVADFMVFKLGRAAPRARQALQELACLGNQAKASTLAIVHEAPLEELESDLWEALRSQLVVRAGETLRFAHDRVQEAAYALIPEADRGREHLRIGRLLLARLEPGERDEALFDIVGHFNRAAALIDSEQERESVAALNLAAGKRAKAAVAYASARNYMAAGVGLLEPGSWDRRHSLAFELEFSLAECEFLTADVMAAQQRVEVLAGRASEGFERCATAALRATILFALQRPDLALPVCLECLRLSGLGIPDQPTSTQTRLAYEAVWSKLGERAIEELADLPLMSDPASMALLDVLFYACMCAILTNDRNLNCVLVCAGVELSMAQGNSDGSCIAYGYFGWISGWQFGRAEGYRFGRLGHALMERKGLRRQQAMVKLIFATQIVPWTERVGYDAELIRSAFDSAMKAGDRLSGVSSHDRLVTHLLLAGESLAKVAEEGAVGLEIARSAGAFDFVAYKSAQAGLVRSLRGLSLRFGSLDGEGFEEDATEQHYATQPHLLALECWYLVRKLQVRYFAGDYAAALAAGLKAQALLYATPALLEVAECQFYTALTHTALHEAASNAEKLQHLQAAVELHQVLESWARDCPENFGNRALLVAAELARVEGRDAEAMRLYDQALRSASEHGFVHQQALANELAARFYVSRGFERIARAYLGDARDGYASWGADGKARQLDELYPHLLERETTRLGNTVLAPVAHFDLATLTAVLQAVSGEIDLDRLIATIMRLAVEHAGAERGLLILPRSGGLRVEAEARTGGDTVGVDARPFAVNGQALPMAALQYVIRTGESLLLRDAATDPSFSSDEYVRARQAHSVLCLPLRKQTHLVGVLYLENNLATGVFTPARMELLRLLSSEAALSLENARLYRDLQEREARMRRLVDSNIVGIAIWHADGRILDMNDAFLTLLGYAREDFASGRVRWADFVPPEWREHDARAMEPIGTEGTRQTHEREYVHKNGTRVPVLAGGAIFDATPDEGVAFVVDLTELKRAEQAAHDSERRFHEAQLRLTDANRVASVGQLAASIAHEINGPLAGITMNASTCLRLLAGVTLDLESLGKAVRFTLRDVNRASDIVTRLRALFANKELAAATVDLNEATREVLELASAGLQRGQVIVHCELAQDLPSITGDAVQLQQVISNLVRNASDAMGSVNDRPRRLVIRTARDGAGGVRLDVQDAGTGLDPALLDKLFEAFYTTKSDGMGVGLSVSRSIIERHNGQLWATPNEGPGATFSFSLPGAVAAPAVSA